ncbi:amidohydrolase family protein [Novosphingobium piscinae]|uniref:Amidohydrolase family protein n=1 Tax=Novosphingobium piscinae TaxID=1507448 RepID=A0A7X1FVB9_9SPHN|nr:amidohydrolase family protein [Novosphingobium piscinae]MBC2667658.1 amidohydrolase family protein [Novosphingobium piscinae]
MLIRRAELAGGAVGDVLLADGVIRAIGQGLAADGAVTLDAAGGCLLPGLHDHHMHVAASSVALQSVPCGPPEVATADDLARTLAEAPGSGWLRGVGYHDSIAGLLDRHVLDAMRSDRPVRVQHRSGRMWFFNSAGIEALLAAGLPLPAGLEQRDGAWTGRLFDEDRWLRDALAGTPPPFAPVGAALLGWGVTGLTEMSPANAAAEADHFAAQQAAGALPQRVLLAGSLALAGLPERPDLARGPFKLHLHEHHLPDWEATLQAMRQAREQGRGTAVHCVSEAELAFAIGLFDELGPAAGDRIEHGSVISAGLLEALVRLELPVVVQPTFVAVRGDQYHADIPAADWPSLYRLASLQAAGLVLAAGSDAPYGPLDPWAAMRAAVERRTAAGTPFGPAEALTPEAALALFLADPRDLGRQRRIAVGEPADCCLLDRPWQQARSRLEAGLVRGTIVGGALRFVRSEPAPGQRPIA